MTNAAAGGARGRRCCPAGEGDRGMTDAAAGGAIAAGGAARQEREDPA